MVREVDETCSGLNCGPKIYVHQESQNVTLFGIRVIVDQGCQTHFHQEPHQPRGCLQRAEIVLGLYKCSWNCINVTTP